MIAARQICPLLLALPLVGCVAGGDDGAATGENVTSATSGATTTTGATSGGPTTTSATADGTSASASTDASTGASTDASTDGSASATTTTSDATSDATSTGESTGGAGEGACGARDQAPGLWCPAPGASWQWQIDGNQIDTSFDVAMYDVDLFEVTDAELNALHGAGRVVICYFSAGSYEEWRADAKDFPGAALGEPLDGWPGERWLDVRDAGVRAVQEARLGLAAARGCDGVEPDNVDGYSNQSGFPLTAADQLDYNLWLAAEAHARGLSVGLKNDLEQVVALAPAFDWALSEECAAYDECELLTPFIAAGKAVFHVEYVDDIAEGPALAQAVCGDALALGFSTLIKEWDLGPWRIACG